MVYGWAEAVTKRAGCPSGKWHPEPELSGNFRTKLICLWHQRQMRFWYLEFLFLLCAGLLYSVLYLLQPPDSASSGSVIDARLVIRYFCFAAVVGLVREARRESSTHHPGSAHSATACNQPRVRLTKFAQTNDGTRLITA
jgi:hypothetical protein